MVSQNDQFKMWNGIVHITSPTAKHVSYPQLTATEWIVLYPFHLGNEHWIDIKLFIQHSFASGSRLMGNMNKSPDHSFVTIVPYEKFQFSQPLVPNMHEFVQFCLYCIPYAILHKIKKKQWLSLAAKIPSVPWYLKTILGINYFRVWRRRTLWVYSGGLWCKEWLKTSSTHEHWSKEHLEKNQKS